MASNTHIEWCDATWNPVVGCSHISPGCDHCYAERMAHRLGKNPATPQYAGLTGPDGKWLGKARFVQKALNLPLTWRNPKRIFVVSMGDLFHPSVYFAWVDQIFASMILAPQHTYMLLTKRPDRMRQYLESVTPADLIAASHGAPCRPVPLPGFPLPQVVLMATVENQPAADERMPHLAALGRMGWRTGASIEPMLGPVDLTPWDRCDQCGKLRNAFDPYDEVGKPWVSDQCHEHFNPYGGCDGIYREHVLSWVVAGGETGSRSRFTRPEWVRSLRDQCQQTRTPFLFKSWGEFLPDDQNPNVSSGRGGIRVGKRRAGRLLDGELHNEFPEAAC